MGIKAKPLQVSVLKDRYQTSFMSPRQSRHQIHARRFVPFNKLVNAYDGFTILPPFLSQDLVHAHNRIPLGASRMICSFESDIPRRFGLADDSLLYAAMMREISSKRCRRLVAMSHFGKRTALAALEGRPEYDLLKSKMIVRHPNVRLGTSGDRMAGDDGSKLVATFLGGHFGRKGGCVSVRVAQKALEKGLPIHINIVSSLQMGESVWLDPTEPDFFAPYVDGLDAANITFHQGLPNAEARELLGRSHFALLPTFGDTFGFSAIEAMAEYTPVIGTRACALPEMVSSGNNGFLVDLPVDENGSWVRPDYTERGTPEYAEHYRASIETLADEVLAVLESMIGKADDLARLRANARRTAEEMYSAERAGAAWDALYERVAAEDIDQPVTLDPEKDFSAPESPDYLFR
ncbi:MAG: glycosyltransferase family 4 protein [Hyphomonas sp.]|nr:glycosyltransferase family 4 protein [Hyphomonas sp.]